MQAELSLQETEAKVTCIMYLQYEPQNYTVQGRSADIAGSDFNCSLGTPREDYSGSMLPN